MGERDGEESGGGGSADPSDFPPIIPEEEESTTIDLSLEGALQPEELRQLGEEPLLAPPTEEERTVAEPVPTHLIAEPPPEVDVLERTVAEPVPTHLVAEPPPKLDPDATFKLPPERSEVVELPGRSSTTTILLIGVAVAGLTMLVTLAVIFGSAAWESSAELAVGGGASVHDAGRDDATLAATEGPDATTEDAVGSTDVGAADATAADAEVTDAGVSDATPEDAASADAGFVIEDPEIPAVVQRMRPRVRARRARRQRRVAIRLHRRRRYDRAEEAWRRALVLQPDNPRTYGGLARTLRALDRDEEAEAWRERAEAASPMRRRRRRRR